MQYTFENIYLYRFNKSFVQTNNNINQAVEYVGKNTGYNKPVTKGEFNTKVNDKEGENLDQTPSTYDKANIFYYIVLTVGSIVGIILLEKKVSSKNHN